MAKVYLVHKQHSHTKKVWEHVHKLSGRSSPYTLPLLTAPDIQTSIEEQADILGEHFSRVSSSAHYTQAFLKYKSTAEKQRRPTSGGTNEPYNSLITLQELKQALLSGKQTAPIPDDIHYEMLAHLLGPSIKALLKFLNKIWVLEKMPVAWKK